MKQQSMNLESIIESVQKCNNFRPFGPFTPFERPSRLFGMDIVESPVHTVPKLKLRADTPVSDKFRAEFDAWLLEMFGTRDDSPIPFGTAYVFGNTIIMRRDAVMALNCAA